MSKKVITPIPIIEDGDMSLASLTSETILTQFVDNVGIQAMWSGGTGTIEVQVSADEDNWTAMTFNPTITQPAGSAGGVYIDINQISAPFIRVVYTRSGGSGTLNVMAVAKEV